MELKSTASFKDVDIDAMLELTSFDDFMRGIYKSRILNQKSNQPEKHPHLADFDMMMDKVFNTDEEST